MWSSVISFESRLLDWFRMSKRYEDYIQAIQKRKRNSTNLEQFINDRGA